MQKKFFLKNGNDQKRSRLNKGRQHQKPTQKAVILTKLISFFYSIYLSKFPQKSHQLCLFRVLWH